MNLKQKVDKQFERLRTARFNSFGHVLKDFFAFFDTEPRLFEIGKNLHSKFPWVQTWVRVFFDARQVHEPRSQEETAAIAYETLRLVYIYASDNMLRKALIASIYPTEFSIYEYQKQSEIDENYVTTFKDKYLENFYYYVEEQLEEDEIVNKTDNLSTNLYFNAPVGAIQTGNNANANVNQNIGQNFSEILEQLAILKNQFQSLPVEEREEAIEVIDAIVVEVQSENPSKGKIKSFLLATKDFAVKTGTELAASTLAKLLESQMGIKG